MTFIIYTRTNCPNCDRAKNLLQKEEKIIINCDNFLADDRESFIRTMRRKTGWDRIIFPMIFIDDDFLGGIEDLTSHIMFELDGDDF